MSKILEVGQDYVEGHIVETLHKLDDKLELVANYNANGADSSTDNAIVRFDGTSGKLLQNSPVIIDDTGSMTVKGAAGSGQTYFDVIHEGGTGLFRILQQSASSYFICSSSMNVYTSGSNRLIITSTGNIGINTDAPTALLDVNGSSRCRGNATFNGQIVDNAGSAGLNGQVLKKVGGLVKWSDTLSSCSVFNSPSAGTQTGILSLNVKKHDINNEFNVSNSRFTVTTSGLYNLTTTVLKLAATEAKVSFRKNGTVFGSGASRGITNLNEIMDSSETVQLLAGDYIDVYIQAGQVVTDYPTNKFTATLQS